MDKQSCYVWIDKKGNSLYVCMCLRVGGRKFLLLDWIVCYLVFHECDNVRPLVMYRNTYICRKSLWRDTFFINKLTIAKIVLWQELEQFLLVKVILICHKKYDASKPTRTTRRALIIVTTCSWMWYSKNECVICSSRQ